MWGVQSSVNIVNQKKVTLQLLSAFLIYPFIPWVVGVITSSKVSAKERQPVRQLLPLTYPYPQNHQ